jgi:hypothetical protein
MRFRTARQPLSQPPPSGTTGPFIPNLFGSRRNQSRRAPDATDRATLSNPASQRGRAARIVLGRPKPDVVKLLQSRANWVSYGVLHCCSVDVGLLKVRLAPGSDRTTDDSADPGCAKSGTPPLARENPSEPCVWIVREVVRTPIGTLIRTWTKVEWAAQCVLLPIQEIRLHRSFPLDVNRPAGLEPKRAPHCFARRG